MGSSQLRFKSKWIKHHLHKLKILPFHINKEKIYRGSF